MNNAILPKEPTYEMLVAGAKAHEHQDYSVDDTFRPVWKAMVAAAPSDITDELVELACRGFYGERWLRMEKGASRTWMRNALVFAFEGVK